MKSRGEKYFVRLARIGASMYDRFLDVEPINIRLKEIASSVVSKIEKGLLLDVGTGPGRLLLEINQLNPDIELYGLDISASMINIARNNLKNVPVKLQVGSIKQTNYDSNFFSIITCSGSFYLWDYPIESIEEIYRILKNGQTAYLFEAYKDINNEEFRVALKNNLRQLNWIRRIFGPFAIRKSIKKSYNIEEITKILEKTSFASSFEIEKIKLSGIPMWVRNTL
ncbi:MAG: class I SAM-dependent methyltransferase, partial [Bacteroidetes bacterium]|nr:class I SAM-dependent methyltransferase [Bacteroidota bacterium]